MAVLSKLVVELGFDGKGFKSGLDDVGKSLTSFGRTATAAITIPLAAVGVAAVKMASDLSENTNKVNVVFGESAQAIQDWSTTTATSLGISRNEALQASGSFGNLLTNFGLSQEAASKMSMDIVKLAADLGSFNNLPTAQVLEAIRSGLVGESEPLRQLGIDVSDATVKTEALTLGLWNGEDALSSSARAQAVLSLVVKQSGNALNDFQETSGGAANQTKILRAQLADAGAELGTQLLPLLITFTTKLNDLIASYQGLSPQQQNMIAGLGLMAAVIGPLALALGFIITNITAFGAAIGTIIAPLSAATALFVIFAPITVPVSAALVVLKTNVLGLGDAMRWVADTVKSTASAIKGTFTTMVNGAIALFLLLKTYAVDRFTELKDDVLSTVGDLAIAASAWLDVIETYFSDAWDNVKETAGTKVGEMYANVIALIAALATNAYSSAFDIGYQIGNGIIAGISSMWNSVVGYAGSLADAVYDRIKGALKIFSPSRATQYLGEMLGEGLVKGIKASERSVSAASASLASSAMPTVGYSGMGMLSGGSGTGSGAAYGPVTNHFHIDGSKDPQAVADAVFAKFSREMALA